MIFVSDRTLGGSFVFCKKTDRIKPGCISKSFIQANLPIIPQNSTLYNYVN